MAKSGEMNHDPDMPKSLPKAKRQGKQPTLYTGMFNYKTGGRDLDWCDNDQVARLKTFKNAKYTATEELMKRNPVHQECDEATQFFSGSEA